MAPLDNSSSVLSLKCFCSDSYMAKPFHILVLKLRGSYLQQIDHLKDSNLQLGLQSNHCLSEKLNMTRRMSGIQQQSLRCKLTVGHATIVLDSLNEAFK